MKKTIHVVVCRNTNDANKGKMLCMSFFYIYYFMLNEQKLVYDHGPPNWFFLSLQTI